MNISLKELQKITVLYVEDDEVIRTQTQTLFEKMFKRVFIAHDGQESLDIFKKHQDEIDIIVSDINMPNLTGLEMTEEIHKIENKFPVILTTAFSDKEILEKALELNIAKYITKPLKIKELTASILEIVNQHQKQEHIKKITKVLSKKTKIQEQENEQLKNLEDVNKKEINFYKSLIHSLVSHLKIDKSGKILDVSAKFCEYYKYREEEIVDENITKLSNNASEIQKNLLVSVKKKSSVTFDHCFLTKDNRELSFTTTIFPQYENGDSLVSSYVLYQDLHI